MILIDTSAWVEFLRGTGSRANDAVRSIVGSDRVATTDIVVAELRAGATSPMAARQITRMLDACRFFPIRPLFDYESAATIHRECRSAGFTPGSLADCLIAAVAIGSDLEVLHQDADFERIADHTELRLSPV